MEENEVCEKAVKRVEAKLHFYMHTAVYIAISFLLFVINYKTSPEYYWFKWPLLGWGVAIAIHALKVFKSPEGCKLKAQMIEKEIRTLQNKKE